MSVHATVCWVHTLQLFHAILTVKDEGLTRSFASVCYHDPRRDMLRYYAEKENIIFQHHVCREHRN